MLVTSEYLVLGAGSRIHITLQNLHRKHEGFMLGYGKDSHSYRVFNLYLYKIVETVDVQFDETNGSQRELLPST